MRIEKGHGVSGLPYWPHWSVGCLFATWRLWSLLVFFIVVLRRMDSQIDVLTMSNYYKQYWHNPFVITLVRFNFIACLFSSLYIFRQSHRVVVISSIILLSRIFCDRINAVVFLKMVQMYYYLSQLPHPRFVFLNKLNYMCHIIYWFYNFPRLRTIY